MARLDIGWLGVFIEIYRSHSVSIAAARLGMTQGRASGTLAKLRRHFGDPLFARTLEGMAPTPFADRLYPDAVRCMETLADPSNHRAGFDPATEHREFRICMTDISEVVVLPALLNALRELSPATVIDAERISEDSPGHLESGRTDLAVGYMPRLEAGFYQQTLFRQGFVCIASRHHPRIRERLTRQAFERESHVVVTTSGTGHSIVDREFTRRKINRRVALRVPSFLSTGRLVASTELLATVPRRLAESLQREEDVKILPPPVPLPTYAVKLHWHGRYHADPGSVWLRRLIAQLMKD